MRSFLIVLRPREVGQPPYTPGVRSGVRPTCDGHRSRNLRGGGAKGSENRSEQGAQFGVQVAGFEAADAILLAGEHGIAQGAGRGEALEHLGHLVKAFAPEEHARAVHGFGHGRLREGEHGYAGGLTCVDVYGPRLIATFWVLVRRSRLRTYIRLLRAARCLVAASPDGFPRASSSMLPSPA